MISAPQHLIVTGSGAENIDEKRKSYYPERYLFRIVTFNRYPPAEWETLGNDKNYCPGDKLKTGDEYAKDANRILAN